MDESTDRATVKQCCFTVIYFCNKKNMVVTKFFDTKEISSGTAESLYSVLKNTIVEKNIPFSNLVAFSADTTNVMFGEFKSVYSYLKMDLPNIVCIRCSCHMIHLSSSKACLKLPRTVEDLLRNIGAHFSRSALRQERFKEFQTFFRVDIHKILLPCNTRWLSLKACIDRVLEQFTPLKAYFTEVVFSDPSKTTEDMLSSMNNKYIEIYLQFMSYTLGLLNDFNILFQSESPLLHRVRPEIAKLLRVLCSNFIEFSYIKGTDIFQLNHLNTDHHLPFDKVNLGVKASEAFNEIKNDPNAADTQLFLQNCVNFYVELVSDIKRRFNFTDPIFDVIEIVDPVFAQTYKVTSLSHVLKRLPFLNDYVDSQQLDNEWRQHALFDHVEIGLDNSASAENYWKQVFSLTNSAGIILFPFPNLKIVINCLLILPFSNTSVERLFSTYNMIKTDLRNKLHTETISNIIYTKQGIQNDGGLLKFEPSDEMYKSVWNKTK